MNPMLASLTLATPYIRLFKGRTFVVKLGGALLGQPDALEALIQQIAVLDQLGIRLVLVHGGGPQATAMAKRLGIESPVVAGRRVTDDAMLEVAQMVYGGTLNTTLLAACLREKIRAVGISGVDAHTIRATRRPEQPVTDDAGQTRLVDYGWVGDIDGVSAALIEHLLAGGFVPVLASLGADTSGQILNINADTIAAALASALGAAKLLIVSDVAGVRTDPADPGTLVSYADLADLDALEASGALKGGMRPKIAAARRALAAGVERVHLVSGRTDDGLLREIFTNEGSGTLLVAAKRTTPEVPTN